MSETAWKFTFNPAGCKPIDPHGFVSVTVEGAYKMEVKEVGKGEKSIKINGVLVEAPVGAKIWANVGTDMSKPYNADHLYTALLSKGVKPEQLLQGEVNITPETFLGKVMHIYVTPPPPDAPKNDKGQAPFPDVKFITPQQYAEYRAKMGGNKPAAAASNGASAPAGLGKIAESAGGAAVAAGGAVDI